MISALVLTAARGLAPFEVGNDQDTQLEAAGRLVKGQGLTTTNTELESDNISVDPPPMYLTDYPPGLSLIVAAFLYFGLPLLVALKIIYPILTVIGWIGWAIILSHFISRPAVYGKWYSRFHLAIAALLPIFFTPGWGGTDIFLWAGIPFIFMWLVGVDKERASLWSIAYAGLMFGCLYAMRYTSLFLGLAAMLILFQISYPAMKTLLKRSSVFLLSSLTVMLPVTIFLLRHRRPYKNVAIEATSGLDRPGWILNNLRIVLKDSLVTSNLLLGHPVLQQVIEKLNLRPLTYLAGIISLTIILALPILLWRRSGSNILKVKDDIALSLSFLPVSLVIFLIAVGFATQPNYLGIIRYYESIGLCGVLIFYQIATRRATSGIVRNASKAIVLTFVLYVCVYLPALAFSPERKDSLIITSLGFTPSRSSRYQSTSQEIDYPSFILYTRKEGTRTKVKQLYSDNPQALFYAQNYGYFIYDGFQNGPLPGSSFRIFPKIGFWKRAHTTKSVKIFWILSQQTRLDFVPESNQQLIFSDPIEQTKILVSNFSAGPIFTDEQREKKR